MSAAPVPKPPVQPVSHDYADWIGREARAVDVVDSARINALRAALGRTDVLSPGAELPLLYHWLHFWDVRPPDQLGIDGHPAKGGFLPPIPLPRRMWAGGRLSFHAPLRIGEPIDRTSTIKNIVTKKGNSGTLVFVTLEHVVTGPRGRAIVEEQDLVYREPPSRAEAPSLEKDEGRQSAPIHERLQPDPVLLFRFSALTMNSHHIHYDLPYATAAEGYPQLVVHGPLQAIVLADLGARNLEAPVRSFSFRGQAPAFAGADLDLLGETSGSTLSLWSEQGGRKAMVATMVPVEPEGSGYD